MKVFIREPANGESVRGYLPLFQDASGAWRAITSRPVATTDEAVEICIAHHRVALWRLAADAQDAVDRLRRLERGLQRLRDGPREHDRVILRGRECPVASDGSVVMPPGPHEKSGPEKSGLEKSGLEKSGLEESGAWSMPELPGELVVDEVLVDALRRAAGERDMSRGRVLQMVRDMIQDEPVELLLAVAEVAPEHTGRAAELIVAVLQARGERSLSARARAERAPW